MSDDGVNRTVLHWLKLWDGVVFGNKMRVLFSKVGVIKSFF